MPARISSLTAYQDEKTGPAGFDSHQVADLAAAFAQVPDPRSRQGRWHPLTAILLIAACAVTCDADGFTAIWQWVDDAPAHILARLRVRTDPFTATPRPPSERTIRRALALLDPGALESAVGRFTTDKLKAAGLGSARPPVREREQRRARHAAKRDRTRPPGRRKRRTLAFDGKALRGARRPGRKRVNLIGATDHSTATMTTQHEIDTKTNEIPELRTMIKGMDLAGCLITADAAHCQHTTAQAILDAGGDYLLTVKANQAGLLNALIPLFAGTDADWTQASDTTFDRGHGRTEERTVRVADATGIDFPGAAQAFRTVRYRGGLDGQRTSKQVVFGITSLGPQAAGPADIATDQRGHWTVENRTHHVRDTTFDEDHSQVRTGHAPRNMATLRNLAINAFRAAGLANLAHARRHHTHDHRRVLDLYGLS